MRRGLASLIIGLSLLVATVSWAGFTLSRTVLDPGRSERLAEQLLENPQVRDALVDRLADAVEPQIPPEVPVSRGVIESGAEVAIDDPRVQALLVDGVVRFHRNALEGNAEPVVIDAGALGAASRDSLVAIRPELDPFLPATPVIELELPTTGFTWLASIKRFVDRFTLLGALVALAGATIALVVARDRGAVLRRVAFWGYGAAAFWLLIGFAVPRLADLASPTSGAIASAAVDVFFGAMIQPAVTLVIASTIVLLIGFLLPALGGRRGAKLIQPRGATAAPSPVSDPSTPIVRPPAHPPVMAPTAPMTPMTPTTRVPSGPMPSPAQANPTTVQPQPQAHVQPQSLPSAPTTLDPTMVAPQPGGHRPIEHTAEMPRPTPDGTEPHRHADADAEPTKQPWEEGVGYLDETDRSQSL